MHKLLAVGRFTIFSPSLVVICANDFRLAPQNGFDGLLVAYRKLFDSRAANGVRPIDGQTNTTAYGHTGLHHGGGADATGR